MNPKPPIDWPRLLINPTQYTPEQLARLNERVSHWPALCELADTGDLTGAFDKSLVRHVRNFLLLVKAGEWPKARDKYQRIQNIRKTIQLPVSHAN